VDAAGVVLVSGDETGNGSGGGSGHFRAAGTAALSALMIRRWRWEFAKFWKMPGSHPRAIGKMGFDALDAGPLVNARCLEPLSLLNIELGRKLGLGTGSRC
jgi:hypothetical protein